MTSTQGSYILPDLGRLLSTPFKHSFNPHHEQAAKASAAWFNDYYNIVPEHKRAFFQQGGCELLCAHVFPYAGYEELRTMMGMMFVLYVIDEVSDDQSGADAYKIERVLLDVLRDPTSHDGSVFAQMTKQFHARLVQSDLPACHSRLLRLCEAYVKAVATEAENREHNKVLDPEAYINARRENSGVPISFGLNGFALGLDLPDEISDHPVMTRLHLAAVDMVWLANDLYSYNREQAIGLSVNNFITVIMESKQCDLQTAVDHIGTHFKQLVDSFEADKCSLPSWGPQMDETVAKFVMALECWAVGNHEWSFDTPRYFGAQKDEVKRTLVVDLYPKRGEHDAEGRLFHRL